MDGMLVASPPIDVMSSVPIAALAYEATAGGFRAGYQTHEVAVVGGIIDVTPKHFDEPSGTQVRGGTIGLQTTAMFVGETSTPILVADATKRALNVIAVPRGPTVERVTNREDGIEQAWEFSSRPAGDGDLTIEVAVTGHDFVQANDNGLHFASTQGLGFQYSHAVWRDANEQLWAIPSRFEDGLIKITVPEEILAKSEYPALLDPTVSAELYTDSPAQGTTGSSSQNADLISDGTGYFAVWSDQRFGNFDIFSTRLDAAGVPLNPNGISVNQAAGTQQNPSAAFVGNGYVVVWEHVVAAGNSNVLAAFVDGTTNVVTQLGTIAGTASNETLPNIVARGSEALLAWTVDGNNINGAVFSAGAFGAPFSIASGANVEKEPSIAANPTGDYLVTFTETVVNNQVRGQLVSSLGALNGVAFNIAATTAQESQSNVAFDGTNFVVVWSTNDIRGARVSATGTLIDTTGLVINNNTTGAQLLPRIACTAATGCLVVWQDNRLFATQANDVMGATVSNALVVGVNDLLISSRPKQQTAPRVALTNTTYLTAWNDARNVDTTDVRGTRIDGAGAILDSATNLVIVTRTSTLQEPAIAQSTNTTFPFTDIYWPETQLPDTNLVHARFAGNNTQADNPPKIVSNSAASQIQVSAAFGGGNSVAVWSDTRNVDRDIFAARVNISTGAVIDAAGFQVTNGNGDQVVPKVAASNGPTMMVVWQDRRGAATTGFDIFGAIIDASTGIVVTSDIPICAAVGDQTRPSVAFDATNNVYLVAWSDPQSGNLDIRGARVSGAGAMLDAACGVVISNATGSQFSADVAAGGNGQFLVVWEDRRNSATLGDIFGSRVTVTGGTFTVLDPSGLSISVLAGSAQAAPSATFGTSYGSYFVAWADGRNAATNQTDVFGSQVATSGFVSANFAIANTTESETAPVVRPGAPGSPKPFTIAYNKFNSSLGVRRLQVRRVSLGTVQGQACTLNSQCESGFCVDNKCCDTACGGGITTDCVACSIARYGTQDGLCTTIPASADYTCRLYVNSFCDRTEKCDGVSTVCGPDVGANEGRVCNAQTLTVCPSNSAAGAPHQCP